VTKVMIERDLLVAYLRLLKHGDVSVREFQRIMNYRSPGKAKKCVGEACKGWIS